MRAQSLPHGSPGAPVRATHRVFLALWPDDEASAALASLAQNLARELSGRPTPRDRLHITAAFVPTATDDEVARLGAIGAHGASTVGDIDLAVDHLGTFRDSGIVWAAGAVLPPRLVALAAHVRDALQEQGLPVDRRPYRPHFTLVRRASGMLRERTIEAIPCAFRDLTLVRSELASAGPRYTILGRWPLGAISRS